MSKFRDIYALADRLGLEKLPPSASDEEQVQHIAEQLGLDYDGTADSENDILNALYDMEDEDDPFDNGYDEETVESYGEEQQADNEQRQQREQKKEKEETTEGEEGSGENKKDGQQPENGDQAGEEQGGEHHDGEEKGPNDNGYDPDKTDDFNNGGNENAGNNGNQGTEAPKNNGNEQPAQNGEKPQADGGQGSKPGERNPNNDVNKNGSRPDAGRNNGNGYNGTSAQNASKQSAQSTQSSSVGNRNYQHQQRVQRGKQAEAKAESAAKKGKEAQQKQSKLAQQKQKAAAKRQQQKAARRARRARQRARMKKLQQALMKVFGFLMRHPVLLFVLVLILLLVFIVLVIIIDDDVGATGGGAGNGAKNCTYELAGVVSTGEVTMTAMKVELINCDGSASNYTVLDNVDFEKYVLGVALAEIGPDAPDEALKAQIVAARNFALTRNSGMCPGNPDDCFYGYNPSTGKIRMRACEADQVYWDYNEVIYREDRGAISLYSPEIESGTVWKQPLDETRKAEVEALAEEVKGKVLLDEDGNVFKTSYNSTTSDQFTSGANNGDDYQKILSDVYGVDNFESAKCAAAGNIDYGDYTLSSDGHQILHEPLEDFLDDNGSSLEDFNKLIADNVEDAGFGTRAGVVAAAVTLIGELGDNYGVKVPYYWGGGHYDGVVVGALGYWGSDPKCTTYANNQTYDYCGLDCSGFVPWAIKNGGFNIGQRLASDFYKLDGAEKVTLKSGEAVLEPGDLLESDGHVVLVVAIDESTSQYVCAEASGNAQGVLFTRRSFKDSGYWGVKMDGYYNNSVHIRSE